MFPYQQQAKRAHALKVAINQAKQKHIQLEVLIRVDKEKKDKAIKELEKMSKIRHCYKRVPYVAVISEPWEIEQLTKKLHEKRGLFKSWLQGIDIANTMQLFPTTIGIYGKNIWNMEQVGAYRAHEKTKGKGSVIAVLDTGVDYEHSSLAHAFGREKGINFVHDGPPDDDNGHGTHVAGIIASKNYGIAPESKLYSIKMLNKEGSGSEADMIAALEWAMDKKLIL